MNALFERPQRRALTPMLDTDGAAARRYSVVGLPTTFFLDATGSSGALRSAGR